MSVPTGNCSFTLCHQVALCLVPMHTDDQQQHQRELSRAHTHSRTRYQKVGPGGSIKVKLHQSHYKCKQANQIVQWIKASKPKLTNFDLLPSKQKKKTRVKKW